MLTVLSQTAWSSFICALFLTISPAKKHCSSAPAALHGILQDDLELQGGAPERRLHDGYGDRFLEDTLFEDQLPWMDTTRRSCQTPNNTTHIAC